MDCATSELGSQRPVPEFLEELGLRLQSYPKLYFHAVELGLNPHEDSISPETLFSAGELEFISQSKPDLRPHSFGHGTVFPCGRKSN